jgi:WD40 repeat protein
MSEEDATSPNAVDPDGPTLLPVAPRESAIHDQPTLHRGPAAAPVALSPPGYELLDELGRGGMGVVYKARHIALNRLVALKMILAGGHASDEELVRFHAEAEAVARLQHPNVVQIHEVGEHDGRPFFSLEFVDGGNLARQLDGKPQPARRAAELIQALARAMHAAHQRGIVHRDLKPANILLTADGTPKITDFGLAKQLDSQKGLTQSGAILGTPSYMAPEQADGKRRDVGPATDVYALGAILYEMLTGRPPFLAETPLDTLVQVVGREPVPPSQLQAKVPRDLETICLKCLQKEPRKRYASAEELADDLGRFLTGEPIRARPVGAVERLGRWCRRNPVVAGLILTAVFLLLAGTGMSSFFAVLATAEKRYADKAAAEAAHNAWQAEAEARAARRSLYIADMNLAQRAWEDAQVGLALQLLQNHVPRAGQEDLRGFEWYHLQHLCHPELRTLRGGTGRFMNVAFHPGGRWLASAGQDGVVRIWEVSTGNEIRALKGHKGEIAGLAFNRDGSLLASAGGEDKSVRVWNPVTGQEFLTLTGHEKSVYAVVFSPDGQRVASASEDTTVRLWDSHSGREVAILRGHTDEVWGVAFSPEGRRLASASLDGSVRLWDVGAGRDIRTVTRRTYDGFRGVAFAPDGRTLAAAGLDHDVYVWDAEDGREIVILKGHTMPVYGLTFSPDGRRLASTSEDRTVRVWDVRGGPSTFIFRGHGEPVYNVAFSPDGLLAASAGEDETVKVWQPRGSRDVVTVAGIRSGRVAFRPDGQVLAASSADRTIRLLDVDTGREIRALRGHSDIVWAVAFSPDGRWLASASDDKTVRLWDVNTGKEIHVLASPSIDVAFSPDGRLLAAGGRDKTIRLWNRESGHELRTLGGHAEAVERVLFSPDGRLLASLGGGTVRLWEVASGHEVRVFEGVWMRYPCLALSPDGQRLAAGQMERLVRVWDVISGQDLFTLRGHSAALGSLAFHPDGGRLASAGDEDAVRLWEMTSGREVGALKGNLRAVFSLAFSPDGQRLASVTWNGPVRIWDARPLTPELLIEREAQGFVDALFAVPLLKVDVLEQIRHLSGITDEVRQKALALTDRYRDEPEPFNWASWAVVRNPAESADAYRLALRHAEIAHRLAPDSGFILNTLGVAQYRTGQYAQALQTLARSDQLNAASSRGSLPADLAFLAMTHHQLGQLDQAAAYLDRLRQSLKAPRSTGDEESQTFLREAEALIQGKGKPSEKRN